MLIATLQDDKKMKDVKLPATQEYALLSEKYGEKKEVRKLVIDQGQTRKEK